jgi:hypothetical protein
MLLRSGKIPFAVYEYLQDHPDTTGRELEELGLVNSDRSGRRFKNWFKQGIATPVVSSSCMDQLEPDIELEDELERLDDMVAERQNQNPVFTTDRLKFDGTGPVAVMFVSCIHLGGRYTAYKQFRTILDQALSLPRVYWASLGDDIEGFLSQFPDAQSVSEQLYQLDNQFILIEKLLNRLNENNRLLFGMGSQHGGKWLSKRWGMNPIKRMFTDRGRPYYDGMAYLKFDVGDIDYNVAIAHTFSGGSAWNDLHSQTKALRFNFPNADVVVQGDKHKYAVSEVPAYDWEYEIGNRKSNRALLLQAGTAKTGPDPYTILNWSKGQLGWPTVVFYPDTHKIKWSWDLNDVKEWLK